jgi:hypothetical protein
LSLSNEKLVTLSLLQPIILDSNSLPQDTHPSQFFKFQSILLFGSFILSGTYSQYHFFLIGFPPESSKSDYPIKKIEATS